MSNKTIATAGFILQQACFDASLAAGWWTDHQTGISYRQEARAGTRFGKALVAEKLALIHSEISEGLEGHRAAMLDREGQRIPVASEIDE